MKRTLHRLRRRGPVDRRMSVRAQHPWYLKLALAVLLAGAGYGLAYWQLTNRSANTGLDEAYVAQLSAMERQLQVERATSSNAHKEMAALQDEVMRLKEDLAFYEGILSERGAKLPARNAPNQQHR
jgi:hypothetical protein